MATTIQGYISDVTLPNSDKYPIRAAAIPYGEVDSTSTSTAYTATIPGIYSLEDGVCVMLKNGVVTSASGFTIDINDLGAKPVYSNMATGYGTTAPTRDTTIFNINYTMLLIYSTDIVSGGGWICYRGYDANTNTIGYQLRTNATVMNVTDTARYYKMYFMSADNTGWVPASVNSTNNATAIRPVNQRPINPFGRIVYTSANTNYTAGANLAATTIWDQYTLVLGYSFNNTGAALAMTVKKPVYLKCAPQANGSAIMDADNPIVQSLPSSADGKIYIYLGVAYDATHLELVINHPVYYHDGTGIKLWSGSDIPTKTSQLTNDSGFITEADIPEGAAAYTGTPSAVSTTAAKGTSNAFARGDHVHNITGSTITDALGYIPYNSTNPNGYTSNVGTVTGVKINGTTKNPTSGIVDIGTVLTSYTETDPTVPAWAKASTKPTYTAAEVGAIPTSQKGANSGVAELDANGKVPSSQLPSYVDDVLEYTAKSSFPTTGEMGKIYVDTTTNLTYRWSGSAYVEISPSLALGTTSSTAFRGDYGNTAYNHATDSSKLTTATSSGLYKVASTAQGHIASLTAVQKSDITALGIPAQDTTYVFDGTYDASTNKAATVSTVSNAISSAVPSAATATPLMDGTASVGTSSKYAKEDHVHPSDSSKVDTVSNSSYGQATISNDEGVIDLYIEPQSGSTGSKTGITIDGELTRLYNGDNNYLDATPSGFLTSYVRSSGQQLISSVGPATSGMAACGQSETDSWASFDLGFNNNTDEAQATLCVRGAISSGTYPENEIVVTPTTTTIKNVVTPVDNGDAVPKSYVDGQVATKQATLVSGTNIKTVNGNSLLGSGDLTISDSDQKTTQTNTATTTNATYRVILSQNANDTTETTGVRKVSTLLYNPSQASLYIGDPSAEHLTLGKTGITFDTGSTSSSFGKTQIDNWNTAATWVTNNSTAALADNKVAQNNSTAANDFRVLLSNSVSDSNETAATNKSANLRFMPSTNHLYVGSAGQDALITVSPRMHLGAFNRYTQTGEAESSTSYGVGLGIDNSLAYNSYLTNSALLFQHWNASRPSGGVPSSTNYVDNMCSISNAHILFRDYSGKDSLTAESELTSTKLSFISNGTTYTVTPTKINKWDDHVSNGNYSLTAATTQAVYPIKIDNRGHISAYGSAVTVPTASTTAPLMDGTASYGTGTLYARSNHVHPTDTSRAAKDNFVSFTVSSTTTTKSLTSGHIYLLVTKRMNNSAAGGLYIVAPHTTTGSVTEVKAGTGTTVSISKTTLTITTTASNIYCRLVDLNMPD